MGADLAIMYKQSPLPTYVLTGNMCLWNKYLFNLPANEYVGLSPEMKRPELQASCPRSSGAEVSLMLAWTSPPFSFYYIELGLKIGWVI